MNTSNTQKNNVKQVLLSKHRLTGWGHWPAQTCLVARPEKYANLPISQTTIARGQGRSYGDASLNNNGQVLLTERLNRLLSFDKNGGVIKAEAGTTLAEILNVIVPAGWFLPVIPGTQFVSLGGCVASDVHGKNHHHAGSFCQYVHEIEIITAENKYITCSATQNSAWFWATVGGMGLTGIIGTVTLKLIPIESAYLTVNHYATNNLAQTFEYLSNINFDSEYSVAWLDCASKNNQLGRGIIMNGYHTKVVDLPSEKQTNPLKIAIKNNYNIPIQCPSWLLNKYLVKHFNNFYYNQQAKKSGPFITDYKSYFFPLDTINNWNRLYGKNGFTQYQCVLPLPTAFEGIKEILEKIQSYHIPIFLAVLKRFGESQRGLLSFPMPGYTLSLDIALAHPDVFELLHELDSIVIANAGRIYLAKDATLSPVNFRGMYAQYTDWLKYKNNFDPNYIFYSSLANRLEIGK